MTNRRLDLVKPKRLGAEPSPAREPVQPPIGRPESGPGSDSSSDLADRANRLLELGHKHGDAGNPVASREAFQSAAQAARSLNRPDLLAKAAVGMGRMLAGAGPGVADFHLISIIEEALSAVGAADSPDRALLLARLAVDLYWSRDRARAIRLAREGVEVARRLGDIATLIAVLDLRQWMLWGPANLEQRLTTATEMMSHARAAADWEALLNAHRTRLSAMLEMGEIQDVDAELAEIENVTRSVGISTGYLERYRAMRALMRGELDDAEQWLNQLLRIAQQRDDRQLLFTYFGQLGELLHQRGRVGEMASMLSGPSSAIPQLPVVRMAVAVVYARTGRLAQARTEFDYLAADEFDGIPEDWNWLGTLAHLAEVALKIGDLERARTLYRLLAPYSGRGVTLGYGDVYYNSVTHYLGLLSTALNEPDRARREFESALRFNRRMGAGVALAYTQASYAAMLLKSESPDDRRHAAELLRVASETAQALQLSPLIAATAELAESHAAAGSNQPVVPARQPDTAIFRREGDLWLISWEGTTVRARDLKGMQALAYLLARPGQLIHISELSDLMDRRIDAPGAAADLSARDLASADAGPMLDAEAKAAYRRQLRELRLELQDAESMNDAARIERVTSEIGFLEAELIRAAGLGGRARSSASVGERMRVRVTNAIRFAIAQLGKAHPSIGDHLRVSIRTGSVCSYSPDPKAAPTWLF